MKVISISAVFAALLAVAVAQETTTTEGTITLVPVTPSPTTSPTDVPTTTQTVTETTTVLTTTTDTTDIPTTATTTVSGPPSTATPNPPNAANAMNAPVKAVIALGGGVAFLAQLL